MENYFMQPERPFLCLFKDRDEASICWKATTLWCEDIEEVKQCIREYPSLELMECIEINSCRDIDIASLTK